MRRALVRSVGRRRRQTISESNAAPDVDLRDNEHLRKEFIELKKYQNNVEDITPYDLDNVSVVSDVHMAAYDNDEVSLRGLTITGSDVNEGTTGCPKLLPDKHEDTVSTTYAAFFEGTTPLMMAAYHGNTNAMRILTRAGAKVDEKDCVGNTAFVVGVSNRQLKACKYLKKRGADINVVVVSGLMPLLLAFSKNNSEICRWLINAGAQVDAFDRHGRTCLHYAAWNSNQAMMNLLLDHGIEPNVRDVYGKTPLHYAMETDQIKFRTTFDLLSSHKHFHECGHFGVWKAITFLLNRGADANAQDTYSTSPTHILIKNIQKARVDDGIVYLADNRSNELFLVIFALLVKFGADLQLKDDTGRTALALLESRRNEIANRIAKYDDSDPTSEQRRRPLDNKRSSNYHRHNDAKTVETRADEHREKQLVNPFSEWEGASHRMKLDKADEQYGQPIEGSKTQIRGKMAGDLISSEILELCQVISQLGSRDSFGKYCVRFQDLFEAYTRISNKLVGMLIRARKQGLVEFDGEMLYQKRDDEVLITLAKVPEELKHVIA